MAVKPFIYTGNVGIGTSALSAKTALAVYNGNLQVGSSSYGVVFPDGTFQTTAATTTPPGGTNRAIQYNNNGVFGGNVNIFSISSTGNVGIGTSTPTSNLHVVGTANIYSTTASISTTTGAIVTAGGVGIGGNLNVGGNIVTSGTGGNISGINTISTVNVIASGNISINANTPSTSTTTGALIVAGGVGINGNLNVGGSYDTFSGNVGIGTSSVTGFRSGNILSLFGNINISNSSTTTGQAGIYFPDGTFQNTAFNSLDGVISFSAGSTGLTPSSATAGVVTLGGTLNLTSGGTNANLTANNGGVVWSNATQLQILSASSTSGNVLLSGGASTPSWGYSYTSSNVPSSLVSRDANGNISVGNTSATTFNVSTVGSYVPVNGVCQPGINNLAVATNSVQRMVVDSNGNVGIGTASTINTLHVQGNVTITGDTTVQGTLYETSDIALKENVETVSDAMSIVNQLRGVNFNWKFNKSKSSGVIAQELEEILPHLVREDEQGYKSVNYTAIIGILIEAIKELSDKVEK